MFLELPSLSLVVLCLFVGERSSGFVFLYDNCAAGLRLFLSQPVLERPRARWTRVAFCSGSALLSSMSPRLPVSSRSLRSGAACVRCGLTVRSATCLHSAHSHSSPREGGLSIKWYLAPLRLRLPGAVEFAGPRLPCEGSVRWRGPRRVTQH